MQAKITGLAFFWFIADLIATQLAPTGTDRAGDDRPGGHLACIGSLVLSVILGSDGFDHLSVGFALALPGWLLTRFVLDWRRSWLSIWRSFVFRSSRCYGKCIARPNPQIPESQQRHLHAL
jgi:hypothetical protein